MLFHPLDVETYLCRILFIVFVIRYKLVYIYNTKIIFSFNAHSRCFIEYLQFYSKAKFISCPTVTPLYTEGCVLRVVLPPPAGPVIGNGIPR